MPWRVYIINGRPRHGDEIISDEAVGQRMWHRMAENDQVRSNRIE